MHPPTHPEEPLTQPEVMRALAKHAKTLGWEISEWTWKDDDSEGHSEYQLWLHPVEAEGEPA